MLNEAAFAVFGGLATPEDIDSAMKLGTNQPMGPLTLADFIGLETLYDGFKDPKYRERLLRVPIEPRSYAASFACASFEGPAKTRSAIRRYQAAL